jgi:hypothetical protein
MRFRAEHRFDAGVAPVLAVLVDPAFHRGLRLPDCELLDVVEAATDGGEAVLRLRYEFVGHLDAVAHRLLGGRSLRWSQDLRLDVVAGTGRLTVAAEADPRRLHGEAAVTVRPRDGGSARTIDGELVVAAPLVGGMAERRIVPGLLRRLDIEAAAVDAHLAGA